MESQNDSVIINHDANSKLERDPNSKSPINQGKKVTVIAGDSIIKNIEGWRLSDCGLPKIMLLLRALQEPHRRIWKTTYGQLFVIANKELLIVALKFFKIRLQPV